MKIVVALILIGACSLIAFAQTDSRSELLKSCRSQRAELAVLENSFWLRRLKTRPRAQSFWRLKPD